jgi:DNA-binding MarR family transcriptional regulator
VRARPRRRDPLVEPAWLIIRTVTAPTEVDVELSERLAQLISWARIRVYDVLAARAGVEIDVSSMLVLASLNWRGPSRTSDLAAAMGLDPSTVSRHVGRTVEKGWVQKEVDSKDGRAALLSLTRSGKRTRDRLWREWPTLLHQAIDDWTPEEREQFMNLLGRLHDALVQAT